MNTKKVKSRTKSENEAGSLWEQFQFNSSEILKDGQSEITKRTQNENEASSLWEQFQINSKTPNHNISQIKNIAQRENEVSSLWEEFQSNNKEVRIGKVSDQHTVNMKEQCSDLVLFVNGKE